jgi:hypothetical protein
VIGSLLAQPWQAAIAAPFLGAALVLALPGARLSCAASLRNRPMAW